MASTVYETEICIGAGIFPFTQAQANVFDFTAFAYIYFAFSSLVIVVEPQADHPMCSRFKTTMRVMNKVLKIAHLNHILV